MNDWRGVEIKVGSLVVYPRTQSSILWMIEAEVVELEESGRWIRVKRLRKSRYEIGQGAEVLDEKIVTIQGRFLTVVRPVAEIPTYAEYLERYGQTEIEIDGRAT